MRHWLMMIALGLLLGGCKGNPAGAEAEEYEYGWQGLLAGPGQHEAASYDEELARIARIRDRQFHVFIAHAHGVNTETNAPDEGDNRQVITDFLNNTDSWDFEAETGKQVTDVITAWHKVAGMYGGAGVGADAYRYGVLRDQHYPEAEVTRAREILLAALDRVHMAVAITGNIGIARGFANRNFAGAGEVETVPLFDGDGNPLPEPKNNGTWREDNSEGNQYPDFKWEDSCSRDMMIGWIIGWGAAWEVIRDDEDVPQSYRDRMRDDARVLMDNLRMLRQHGEEQYDLELLDADGRTTYHGYLHEENIDRVYTPGVKNGFHAIMALGLLTTLETIAEDPDVTSYVYDEILGTRDFIGIIEDQMILVDVSLQTNYSNVNMAFDGVWLASRFLRGDEYRRRLREAARDEIYARRERDGTLKPRQPIEQSWTWYDWVHVSTLCGAGADSGCTEDIDEEALARGLQTMHDMPQPPFFEFERINCDEQEIASGDCTAIDGTHLTVLGYKGRNDSLITEEPVPMRIRPISNYYWRSTPYSPNGGSNGAGMYSGVDFRLAYWLARWVRR